MNLPTHPLAQTQTPSHKGVSVREETTRVSRVVSEDTGEILGRCSEVETRLRNTYPTAEKTKSVSCYNGWFFQTWFQKLLGGTLLENHGEIPDLLLERPEKNYFFEIKGGNATDSGAMIKWGQLEKFLEYPNCFYAIAYHGCTKPEQCFKTTERSEYTKLIEPVEVYILPIALVEAFYQSDTITEKPKRWVSLDHTKSLRACRARELFALYSGPLVKKTDGIIHAIGFDI